MAVAVSRISTEDVKSLQNAASRLERIAEALMRDENLGLVDARKASSDIIATCNSLVLRFKRFIPE